MINCPNCKSSVENNDIFCYRCGFNLITESVVKKADEVVKTQLKLDADTMTKYLDLEKRINGLTGVEEELNQQQVYLQNLNDSLVNAQHRLQDLSTQRFKEYKDVEKIKGLSISSVFARIKGDREEKIEKEELEYINILNKEESAKKEVEDLKQLIQQAQKQINELNRLVELKNELSTSLEGLILDVCEGVADPIEDKIEQELRELVGRMNPIDLEKRRIARGQGHLKNAEYNLDEALQLLGSAASYSTWDTFFGGGLFVDSIKHSRMADARNYVHQAQNAIQLAKRELPDLPFGVGGAHVEEISFFWDGFMDNIFSDFSSRGKIQRSRESVRQALHETREALNWINQQLYRISSQYQVLEKEVEATRQKLFIERKRMIEEAIARKS
ncbi:MAG: hypothetical protein ACFFDT_40855 [Candidatus Hodarchaeota archaeon]